MSGVDRRLAIVVATALAFAAHPAMAQFVQHHPFAVGANEGAVGHQNAVGAWILAQESRFYLALTGAVQATKAGARGAFLLIGLSFAYGVFHAAGPGHGKAVITSYMVSNEVALKRGLAISLFAALLQGGVATAIVGIAAFVFDATAPRMTAAAQTIEFTSYLGIVVLGLVLVWRKGRAVLAVLRPAPSASLAFAAPGFDMPLALPTTSRFVADVGDGPVHGDDCDCGHAHMPDPTLFEQARFDWRAAATAVATAGARPCSGAILVLVFALSQGIFVAGIVATFAMSLGTAVTTGALAATAVFAKGAAMRLSGQRSARARLVARVIEFGAASAVLLFGIALLTASLAGVHMGA